VGAGLQIGVGIGGGAFAEYMVLPAAGAVHVPAGWADEQALGLVVSWPGRVSSLIVEVPLTRSSRHRTSI
jgi:NADPH2:quinone reductase